MRQKKNLNFIVNWGANKISSWSGTNYSLYKALQNYYNIKEYQLDNPSKLRRIINRLLKIRSELDVTVIKNNQKKFNDITGLCFQFADIVSTTEERPTYIYQDLSTAYLYAAKFQPLEGGFEYSGYDKVPVRVLEERNHLQVEYYKTATGIFTMGKWLANYLKEAHREIGDKVYHVGGGINLDKNKINPSLDKKNNKILFVGRDFERKGGIQVLEAFKLLNYQYPELEFHIAGPKNNPDKEGISNIFFYGDADRATLEQLFNECDVFCLPSNFEAYGLVFIEALCFGLPCIGRNAFEMPYFIDAGKTGELVSSDSPMELAELIIRVLHSDSYKENVMRNKSYYLSEYSWDTVAKRISDIIG